MNKSFYIETTIPSFYHTLRTDPESVARMNWTRKWWEEYATTTRLTTSAAVIDELRKGRSRKTADRIAMLDWIELLPITDEAIELASLYIANKLMPDDPGGDAMHLAVASLNKIDVLLTWNCRHLANVNKLEHFRIIHQRLGIWFPLVTTPLNFSSEGKNDA